MVLTTVEFNKKPQVTRLGDTQTYNQANPSVSIYKAAESRPDKIESTSNNV